MTKTPHQSSEASSERQSQDVVTSHSSAEEVQKNSNFSQEVDKGITGSAMSLESLLKIAELSRKHGPLFYQDPLIMESLAIPKGNLVASPRNCPRDNSDLISAITHEIKKR